MEGDEHGLQSILNVKTMVALGFKPQEVRVRVALGFKPQEARVRVRVRVALGFKPTHGGALTHTHVFCFLVTLILITSPRRPLNICHGQ